MRRTCVLFLNVILRVKLSLLLASKEEFFTEVWHLEGKNYKMALEK